MNNTTLNSEKVLVYLSALTRHIPHVPKTFEIPEGLDRYVNEASAILGYKNIPPQSDLLQSIYNIVLENKENGFIAAKPFTLQKEVMFPKRKSEIDSKDCMALLREEIGNIQTKDPYAFSENLFFLLQTFTSNLPEPSGNYPGVSFFDYVKILSALSVCLYEEGDKAEPFLLVRADVSGIQDYILNIASKHAAKNLKGRSFYIRLLSDTIMYKMLWDLGCFQSNILFASGGNFMLLIPASAKKQFEELTAVISDMLFQEHKTNISLVFGCIELSRSDLKATQLREKIALLFSRIDQKKKQKFSEGITSNFDDYFVTGKVDDVGGSIRRDAITGEEFGWNEKVYWEEKGSWKGINAADIKSDEEQDYFKKLSKKQIELGKQLKDTKFWIIANEKWSAAKEEEIYWPCKLGVYHYLIEEDRLPVYKQLLNTKTAFVLQINQPDYYQRRTQVGADNIFGFTFYGGNGVPVFEMRMEEVDEDNEDVYDMENNGLVKEAPIIREIGVQKTFNHLAFRLKKEKDENKFAGKAGRFSRLGILRMDVDGLGWLFSEGLAAGAYKHYNLLTYTALSRSLDTFFMGYLNTIWENEAWRSSFADDHETGEQLKHNTQIIYSGGDDLFIIGRWDACIHFAKTISREFSEYTMQRGDSDKHPQLSISGGVAMVTHKFPIIKGAEFAGAAEKAAKNYEAGNFQKNAFTIWKPLHWSWEIEIVESLKNEVAGFMAKNNKDDYKSVFQRIMAFYELKAHLEREPSKQNFRWIWLMTYNLSRTIEQYSKDLEFCNFLDQIRSDVFSNSYNGKKDSIKGKHSFFDLLHIAIRWAELEYRTFYK